MSVDVFVLFLLNFTSLFNNWILDIENFSSILALYQYRTGEYILNSESSMDGHFLSILCLFIIIHGTFEEGDLCLFIIIGGHFWKEGRAFFQHNLKNIHPWLQRLEKNNEKRLHFSSKCQAGPVIFFCHTSNRIWSSKKSRQSGTFLTGVRLRSSRYH